MADAEVLVVGRTNRVRPNSSQPENAVSDIGIRLGPYNEQFGLNLSPGRQALAEEGSYFYVTNPAIGTGVAHANLNAFTATSALFAFKNTSLDKRVGLDFIRLTLTATVPTTKLTEEILVAVDSSAQRLPTANATKLIPVSNLAEKASIVEFYAFNGGLLTVPTGASSERKVSRGKIPLNVSILHDTYTFQFAGADYVPLAAPLTAVRATQAAAFSAQCAPVVVEPGSWCVIYRWGAGEATNANTYEYEVGLSER